MFSGNVCSWRQRSVPGWRRTRAVQTGRRFREHCDVNYTLSTKICKCTHLLCFSHLMWCDETLVLLNGCGSSTRMPILLHPFICSFVRPFAHSFIKSLIHSPINSFLHTCVHPCITYHIRFFLHLYCFINDTRFTML